MKDKREPGRFPLIGERFARARSLSEQVGMNSMIAPGNAWEAI